MYSPQITAQKFISLNFKGSDSLRAYESPTILSLSAQIDRLLKQHSPQKLILNYSNTLIKLSTGTFPTPLFLVHPVGGSVFWYQQLAKQLEGKYTVTGFKILTLKKTI